LTFLRQIGRNAQKEWVFPAREVFLSLALFKFSFLDPQPAAQNFSGLKG
jgi:hypothetical protein